MNSRINGVTLTDVRRFAGEHHVDLSRVNLLVGTNSIGKTSFLGCVNAIGRIANFNELNDKENYFDTPPFNMGPFDTIARRNSKKFRVGLDTDGGTWRKLEIDFTRRHDGVPEEVGLEWHLHRSAYSTIDNLIISREGTGKSERWVFEGPDFKFRPYQTEISYTQFTTWLSRSGLYGVLPFLGEPTLFKKRDRDQSGNELVDFVKYVNFFRHQFQEQRFSCSIKAIEPYALKPRRRYFSNPFPEVSDPSSLSRLEAFGSELGIFNKIAINREDDTYEILVDTKGEWDNLNDVGYGVTSVLPLLITLTTEPKETLFLLQQPEVHLHPTAQAQLVNIIARSEQAFIIETHSDHIIDWCRILVKEKVLHHADVNIIYFDEDPDDQTATRLHQIVLDERANIRGQPLSYREFFSDETFRLLGIPS